LPGVNDKPEGDNPSGLSFLPKGRPGEFRAIRLYLGAARPPATQL